MKERAKNAVRHEVEVLGKTVPTLAIVALFLVGAGSAALLTQYGTVEGTAEVDQAIVFGDNGNAEGTTYLETFDTSESESIYAGSTVVDNETLTNNRNQTIEARFNSSQSFTATQGDASDEEGTVSGMDTGFVAVRNLDERVEISSGADEVNSEFVVDQEDSRNRPALSLDIDKNEKDGEAVAGIRFNVDQRFDGGNTIEMDYREGSDHESEDAPDWIYYNVTADEDKGDVDAGGDYVVADLSVNEGSPVSVTWNDSSTFGNENVYAYKVGEWPNTVPVSDLKNNADIDQVKFATGTGDDTQNSQLFLYDIKFAGDTLMRAIPHVDESPITYNVPPGDTEVFVVNELAINAYPGQYTVQAQALPLDSQTP